MCTQPPAKKSRTENEHEEDNAHDLSVLVGSDKTRIQINLTQMFAACPSLYEKLTTACANLEDGSDLIWENVDVQAFQIFLNFVLNKTPVPHGLMEDCIINLLDLALYYHPEVLINQTVNRLFDIVNVQNVCRIYDKLQHPRIENWWREVVEKHLKRLSTDPDFFQTGGFVSLSQSGLGFVLSQGSNNVQLLHGLIRWWTSKKRMVHVLSTFLKMIHFYHTEITAHVLPYVPKIIPYPTALDLFTAATSRAQEFALQVFSPKSVDNSAETITVPESPALLAITSSNSSINEKKPQAAKINNKDFVIKILEETENELKMSNETHPTPTSHQSEDSYKSEISQEHSTTSSIESYKNQLEDLNIPAETQDISNLSAEQTQDTHIERGCPKPNDQQNVAVAPQQKQEITNPKSPCQNFKLIPHNFRLSNYLHPTRPYQEYWKALEETEVRHESEPDLLFFKVSKNPASTELLIAFPTGADKLLQGLDSESTLHKLTLIGTCFPPLENFPYHTLRSLVLYCVQAPHEDSLSKCLQLCPNLVDLRCWVTAKKGQVVLDLVESFPCKNILQRLSICSAVLTMEIYRGSNFPALKQLYLDGVFYDKNFTKNFSTMFPSLEKAVLVKPTFLPEFPVNEDNLLAGTTFQLFKTLVLNMKKLKELMILGMNYENLPDKEMETRDTKKLDKILLQAGCSDWENNYSLRKKKSKENWKYQSICEGEKGSEEEKIFLKKLLDTEFENCGVEEAYKNCETFDKYSPEIEFKNDKTEGDPDNEKELNGLTSF